ncbi:MAG: hypothetical protein P1V34_05700, partial [Alphaproteobacteria bacterium]|nr:hypothetical protein [Alphaproteobacteria bacterium]
HDTWTLYPQNKPTTVHLSISVIKIGSPLRDAILIEGSILSVELARARDQRLLDATQYTAIMISYFTFSGALISMNPAAVEAYGRQLTSDYGYRQDDYANFRSRFLDTAVAVLWL